MPASGTQVWQPLVSPRPSPAHTSHAPRRFVRMSVPLPAAPQLARRMHQHPTAHAVQPAKMDSSILSNQRGEKLSGIHLKATANYTHRRLPKPSETSEVCSVMKEEAA